MTLYWNRRGAGSYEAMTGRTRYLVTRPDFSPQWIVTSSGRHVGLASTLREGKALAQQREDAVRSHLRSPA